MMRTMNIKSKEDIVNYVNEVGYLPFFRNHIAGISLEDMVEPIYWYDGFADKPLRMGRGSFGYCRAFQNVTRQK